MVGQSIIHATVTASFVFSPPCSWDALLGESSATLNCLSLPWETGMVIQTVIVHLWVIYCNFWIPFGMCFVLWSAGMWWRSVWGFLDGYVGWSSMWSAAISGVSWRASMWRWSVMWSVTARTMCVSGHHELLLWCLQLSLWCDLEQPL